MDSRSKVVITGASGFTGKHLTNELEKFDYQVHPLKADLTDRDGVFKEIKAAQPNYVVHLGGISFAGSSFDNSIYDVNVFGTLNLLDALKALIQHPDRVILASSASVYGQSDCQVLHESLCPNPISHYGNSKLVMENMAHSYRNDFPILITRPFNYTGLGHDLKFVIPKIVSAYTSRVSKLDLGNVNVFREFNDVRDVCVVYRLLLEASLCHQKLNVCSGRLINLRKVIDIMSGMSELTIEVVQNAEFIRTNEISHVCGDTSLLNGTIDFKWEYDIEDTLLWMFREV
jgi:nucleoside-diphosphate-sugar epimerase